MMSSTRSTRGSATRTAALMNFPIIIAKIPELEDIDVEGRSVLAPYRNYRSTLKSSCPRTKKAWKTRFRPRSGSPWNIAWT